MCFFRWFSILYQLNKLTKLCEYWVLTTDYCGSMSCKCVISRSVYFSEYIAVFLYKLFSAFYSFSLHLALCVFKLKTYVIQTWKKERLKQMCEFHIFRFVVCVYVLLVHLSVECEEHWFFFRYNLFRERLFFLTTKTVYFQHTNVHLMLTQHRVMLEIAGWLLFAFLSIRSRFRFVRTENW